MAKGLLHGATSMAGMVPMIGMAKTMGGLAAATAAGSAASGVAEATSQVKAKDEWSFSFRLVPAGSDRPVLEKSASMKARADDEDVLSPMIQQAAEAVLGQVVKK